MEITQNNETTKKKTAAVKTDGGTAAATVPPLRPRETIALDVIDFDPRNRIIDESSDSFRELLDSVRAFGVIHAPQVQRQDDGRFRLHDGERRVRAARRAGLSAVACDVWPENATAEVILATIAVQQHHEPHRAIHIARRLHKMKHDHGLTLDELAAKTGIPLERVKVYRALLQGSPTLLDFFATHDVPISVAAEMARYDVETNNEGRTRQLIARFKERSLTREDIAELRKREKARLHGGDSSDALEGPSARAKTAVFSRGFVAALKRDGAAELPRLSEALRELGFELVALQDSRYAITTPATHLATDMVQSPGGSKVGR